MKNIIITCLFIFECWSSPIHAKNNYYIDAFTRFVDSVLCYNHEKGDTICVKESLGITDRLPNEISGYKILIVNEFNCSNIPVKESRKGNLYSKIYYIFPMQIGYSPNGEEIIMNVSFLDAIVLNEKKESVYNGDFGFYYFDYKFNREKNDFQFWRHGAGGISVHTPWLFK